jgi:hypothetical protein
MKLAMVRSTIGRRPVSAAPTPMPLNPFSEIGALKMRSPRLASSRPVRV